MPPLNCLSRSADHRCDGFLNSTAASTCVTSVVRSSRQRHGYDDQDGKITTRARPQLQCGAVQLVARLIQTVVVTGLAAEVLDGPLSGTSDKRGGKSLG